MLPYSHTQPSVSVRMFSFIYFFGGTQSCLNDLQPRQITALEGIRLERRAPWQPCGNLVSVLSPAFSQIYCHSIYNTLNKAPDPWFPAYFSNRCTCERSSLKYILGWSGWSEINLLFAIFLILFCFAAPFGGKCRAVKEHFLYMQCNGERRDKLWSLLTPPLGYLWLINWTEKESCRLSRRCGSKVALNW